MKLKWIKTLLGFSSGNVISCSSFQRYLWEMPYPSPIALHFSLSDRWRCGMVSCSQHLEREGRRENPKWTETLWGSQFASHFWFLVILFTFAHLQETTNPVLRAVHASSFSLSRWPAPAAASFTQLQTSSKFWPCVFLLLVTYLHKRGQQEYSLKWIWTRSCTSAWQKSELQSLHLKLSFEQGLRQAKLSSKHNTIYHWEEHYSQRKTHKKSPTKLPLSPACSQLPYREGYKHSEVRKEQRGQVRWRMVQLPTSHKDKNKIHILDNKIKTSATHTQQTRMILCAKWFSESTPLLEVKSNLLSAI